MEHPEEPERVTPEVPVDSDRASFDAIVRALAADRRFFRRVSVPPPHRLGVGHLMVLAAVVSTLLLGVVPLAIGIHTGTVALLVVGAVGAVLLPVGAPLAVRVVLHRVRPLMR